jgi:hypothetical protein
MAHAGAQPAVDRLAFEAAVRSESRKLYGLAYSVLRDAGEAEDAVQETMELAWRAWQSVRDPEHRSAWLRQICLRRCLRLRRRFKNWWPLPDAVELLDLDAGKSLGAVGLGLAGGGVVGMSTDGKHVYACCKDQKLTSLVWDGTSLRVEAQAVDGKDGHRLPSCYGSAPPTSRMLPDGRTLVAYCPVDGRVWWLDLERLTVTKELPVEQGNPLWLAPIWAPDGSMLYLHEPRTNSFQAVDLRRQALVLKTKLPVARSLDPLRWLAERFVISAEAGCVGQTGAVSPDGQSLYLIDGRGLSVRHLPDLRVKTYWRRDAGTDAVWLSGDGRTLYASDHDRVGVFGGDGRLVADVRPGASILGCAW